MIGPVIAAILPIVPHIVQLVESLFSQKPKSGQDKLSTVTAMLRELSAKLAATNQIPRQPTDEELAGVVEAILAQLKASGNLSQTPPLSPQQSQYQLYLIRGSIQELKPIP